MDILENLLLQVIYEYNEYKHFVRIRHFILSLSIMRSYRVAKRHCTQRARSCLLIIHNKEVLE